MIESPVVRIGEVDSDSSPVDTRLALKLRQSSWRFPATSIRELIAFPETCLRVCSPANVGTSLWVWITAGAGGHLEISE